MSENGAESEESTTGDAWETPADSAKQVDMAIDPEQDEPVVLTIAHKDDGLAARATLSVEQLAMLNALSEDLLDEFEDAPEARVRSVESGPERGFE